MTDLVDNRSFPDPLGIVFAVNDRLYDQRGSMVALARERHGFPRGEAVERSETDEERRNGPILYAVCKEGTI